jgi:dolichol-phosphate mannosyltransferase
VRKNERGLSSAVIAGMGLAKGNVLVVMDADLSHPPEMISALVAALDDQAVDFVIGSRYVSGGGTDEDWGLFRYLNSKVATWLARPLTSAKDPMAGFFAIRKPTFERAFEELNPVGYKIGLELIVKGGCRQIAEVPIQFHDRVHGESKLSFREQLNYVRHLKRLYEYRFCNWAYLALFLAVGATGMVVDLLTYVTLLLWLPTGWARGLAIWVAMSWNFFLNRKLTFTYASKDALLRRYLSFCASCSVGATINWCVSIWLTSALPAATGNKLLAASAGIIAGTAFNFVLCRYVVFQAKRPSPDSTEPAASAAESDAASTDDG